MVLILIYPPFRKPPPTTCLVEATVSCLINQPIIDRFCTRQTWPESSVAIFLDLD